MRHRRSRYIFVALALAALVQPWARAEEPASASANGAVAADAGDRLTALARELAQSRTAAPASGPVAAREDLPLGAAAENAADGESALRVGADGGALGTLGALGLVLGLILVGRWAWIRFGGVVVARSSPAVEVLSRTSVAPRNQVLLLRVGGRILVVSESAAGLRTLDKVEEPEEVASLLEAVTAARSASATSGFANLLSNSSRSFAEPDDEGADTQEHRADRARDSLSGLLSRMRTLAQRDGTR